MIIHLGTDKKLTQDYLQEALSYNPLTGDLRWKFRPENHFVDRGAHNRWNSRCAGSRAGSLTESSIPGKNYMRRHRIFDQSTTDVIVLMETGRIPLRVNFKNKITTDFRYENLEIIFPEDESDATLPNSQT